MYNQSNLTYQAVKSSVNEKKQGVKRMHAPH